MITGQQFSQAMQAFLNSTPSVVSPEAFINYLQEREAYLQEREAAQEIAAVTIERATEEAIRNVLARQMGSSVGELEKPFSVAAPADVESEGTASSAAAAAPSTPPWVETFFKNEDWESSVRTRCELCFEICGFAPDFVGPLDPASEQAIRLQALFRNIASVEPLPSQTGAPKTNQLPEALRKQIEGISDATQRMDFIHYQIFEIVQAIDNKSAIFRDQAQESLLLQMLLISDEMKAYIKRIQTKLDDLLALDKPNSPQQWWAVLCRVIESIEVPTRLATLFRCLALPNNIGLRALALFNVRILSPNFFIPISKWAGTDEKGQAKKESVIGLIKHLFNEIDFSRNTGPVVDEQRAGVAFILLNPERREQFLALVKHLGMECLVEPLREVKTVYYGRNYGAQASTVVFQQEFAAFISFSNPNFAVSPSASNAALPSSSMPAASSEAATTAVDPLKILMFIAEFLAHYSFPIPLPVNDGASISLEEARQNPLNGLHAFFQQLDAISPEVITKSKEWRLLLILMKCRAMLVLDDITEVNPKTDVNHLLAIREGDQYQIYYIDEKGLPSDLEIFLSIPAGSDLASRFQVAADCDEPLPLTADITTALNMPSLERCAEGLCAVAARLWKAPEISIHVEPVDPVAPVDIALEESENGAADLSGEITAQIMDAPLVKRLYGKTIIMRDYRRWADAPRPFNATQTYRNVQGRAQIAQRVDSAIAEKIQANEHTDDVSVQSMVRELKRVRNVMHAAFFKQDNSNAIKTGEDEAPFVRIICAAMYCANLSVDDEQSASSDGLVKAILAQNKEYARGSFDEMKRELVERVGGDFALMAHDDTFKAVMNLEYNIAFGQLVDLDPLYLNAQITGLKSMEPLGQEVLQEAGRNFANASVPSNPDARATMTQAIENLRVVHDFIQKPLENCARLHVLRDKLHKKPWWKSTATLVGSLMFLVGVACACSGLGLPLGACLIAGSVVIIGGVEVADSKRRSPIVKAMDVSIKEAEEKGAAPKTEVEKKKEDPETASNDGAAETENGVSESTATIPVSENASSDSSISARFSCWIGTIFSAPVSPQPKGNSSALGLERIAVPPLGGIPPSGGMR